VAHWGHDLGLPVQTIGVTRGTFLWMPASVHQEQIPEQVRSYVDAERLHMARELHDIVAYSFATINVQAGVAAHVADDRPEQAAEALRAIQAISGEASRELRALLGMMRSVVRTEASPHGLARLDALAATTTSAGLPTRVVVSGTPRSLPPAVDRSAYRIAQEALTNALRHAGPATAVVTVRYEPDRLVVEVVDDGHGPMASDAEPEPGSGHGITGMRERALALGGELDAGPRAAGGFRVRVSLPVGIQL
jgi:signal transduction histidine kinase